MNQSIMINTPEGIEAFRLLALKGALKLETLGMKVGRGVSAFKTIKQTTGLKASTAKKLLPLYIDWLKEKGVLVD